MAHIPKPRMAALLIVGAAPHTVAQSPVGCSSEFLYSGFNSLSSRTSTAAIVAAPEATETRSGDFNGDGAVDLAVTLSEGFRQSTLGFSLQFGNGDGTFGEPVFYPLNRGELLGLSVADLNNDGRSDVIVPTFTFDVGLFVYFSNPDGSLQARVPVEIENFAFDTTIADVNGDGNLDILPMNRGTSPGLQIVYGNGDGTFTQPTVIIPDQEVYDVAVGDYDNDGLADLFVRPRSPNVVQIYRQTGENTFVQEMSLNSVAGGNNERFVEVADLDNDGFLDIVGHATNANLEYWLGDGQGGFVSGGALPDSRAAMTYQVFDLGDLDGDGDVDIVNTAFGPDRVQYHINNGDGTFAPAVSDPISEDGSTDVLLADVDSRGQPDLIVTSNPFGFGTVETFLNTCYFFPVVTQQPSNALVSPGSRAVLSVEAGGAAPFTYQWRRNGVAINDTATISGSRSPVLTLDQITREQAGEYDIVITNASGMATSLKAVVAVAPTTDECPADLNGDGDANTFDLLDLLRDLDGGCQ